MTEPTPNQARQMLEEYLNRQVTLQGMITLPVYDCVVYSKFGKNAAGMNELVQYTYKHLLKIAYNLTDKP